MIKKVFYTYLPLLFLYGCATRNSPAPLEEIIEKESINDDMETVETESLPPINEESEEEDLSEDADSLSEDLNKKQESNEKKIENLRTEEKPKNAYNKKSFIWPIKGKILTKFGDYDPKTKEKIQFLSIRSGGNLRVKSVQSGFVKEIRKLPEIGNLLVIDHDGIISVYSKLKEISVQKGQRIQKGDTVGRTSSAPLQIRFFEIKNKKKKAVDPLKYIE